MADLLEGFEVVVIWEDGGAEFIFCAAVFDELDAFSDGGFFNGDSEEFFAVGEGVFDVHGPKVDELGLD